MPLDHARHEKFAAAVERFHAVGGSASDWRNDGGDPIAVDQDLGREGRRPVRSTRWRCRSADAWELLRRAAAARWAADSVGWDVQKKAQPRRRPG